MNSSPCQRKPSRTSRYDRQIKPGESTAHSSSIPRKKVMIVDDHPLTRVGVVELINKQPDLEVCSEAGDATEALFKMPGCHPDLVVADMAMPGRSGVEFIKDLLHVDAQLPIVVLSMHDELIHAERVLRAGARAYVMKEAGGETLLAAVRRALAGERYVSERLSAKILSNLSSPKPRASRSPIEKLSDREFQIFQLIAEGNSTRDVALQLGLSPKTVDVHRANIKKKLQLDDGRALTCFAVRWSESRTRI